MSGPYPSTAAYDVWPRTAGASSGPVPLGGSPSGLPTVANSSLPFNTATAFGNRPPPVPQPPSTPFPSIQQPFGQRSGITPTNYTGLNTSPPYNQMAANAAQTQALNAQFEAYQRRLAQLEGENDDRRTATMNLTQMGTQLLQGQMDVQEQVLQYQFMLEQCMETLDHQNYVLNEQSEELSLLRAKMKHFEYLVDAFKLKGTNLLRSGTGDWNCIKSNISCCRDPLTVPPPSTSPFFAGGATRVTASTFQPFNPRYRSPNSRAATAANLSGRRSVTPTAGNRNFPNSDQRPSRRFGNPN
ncbi:unnamed protein product [Rotaria sp. Silwood1]|nr:unnamed protein product [Rotaria sp. Silwood1]CAF0747682.1 unnamed protein product [Rotaria sp. Silwood1]CAF3335651.1 unnamed protein product [Rotaria sp. Silwood1]CAF3356996.1 unnamed protein product [Rotaria sp. Silwood1]CAF4978529.1 unnamed protein product [Rotaria sp. Silwood1]